MTLLTPRRGLLLLAGGLIAAPALARAESLMRLPPPQRFVPDGGVLTAQYWPGGRVVYDAENVVRGDGACLVSMGGTRPPQGSGGMIHGIIAVTIQGPPLSVVDDAFPGLRESLVADVERTLALPTGHGGLAWADAAEMTGLVFHGSPNASTPEMTATFRTGRKQRRWRKP